MSTTTVGDILDRAENLARNLRAAVATVSTTQWRSFDATAYRLLHELVGPERVTVREQILSHASMARNLNDYPNPLTAPNPHTTYNARQAANHLGVAHSTVVADIHASRPPATFDGRRYSIKATDLPTDTEVHPADPASSNPLDQLTCILGVLADLVVAERSRTTPTPGFDPLRDDAQVAPVVARVFALTIATARHALAHIPLHDADRPLTIAQYAEHSLDALGDLDRPSALNQVASFAPPSTPRTPNEELETALRAWVGHARTELTKTIPSTEVLRDIANQARHLYAVTARLAAASFTAGHLSEATARVVHEELRQPAQIMQRLQRQWETITTATKPSHEYVTATTTLHSSLTALEEEGLLPGDQVDPARRIDLDHAMADLRYAATDLVELTNAAAQLPEPLIRSGLLFAPARILPSTMERIHDRNHGRYVPILLEEGEALIDAAQKGASAARHVRQTLEISVRPEAEVEPFSHLLASGLSRRAHQAATRSGGPNLR